MGPIGPGKGGVCMLKNFQQFWMKYVIVLILCFTMLSGWVEPVSADTCTWTGVLSSSWNTAANWSPVKVPTASDDVIIPSSINDPVIPASYTAVANSITIQNGGQLTLSYQYNSKISAVSLTIESGGTLITEDDSYTSINLSGALVNNGDLSNRGQLSIISTDFTNSGTVTVSTDYPNLDPSITILSPFDNAGTVDIQDGYVWLHYGGEHTGTFTGSTTNTGSWAGLWLGSESVTGETFTFTSTSDITLPRLVIEYGAVVDISGTYTPTGESELRVTLGSDVAFNLPFDGSVNTLAKEVNLGSTLRLNGEGGFSLNEITIFENGHLENNTTASITGVFHWDGGTISGSGTTSVEPSTTLFSIYAWPHTLNGHTLVSNTEADWESGNITLTNGAAFENKSIFNAIATTTMTGGLTEGFTNDGTLYKKTTGTTTTMDLPFTNNGSVTIIAGDLVFQQGIENGEDAVIDLGSGTLDPGETLNLETGDSLIGSGTLSANLVNAGTVSPGESPGIISIDGNYTQEDSGLLKIELGGTMAGTGYDQLVISDSAILGGTLEVNLIPGFSPTAGQVFQIVTHEDGTSQFDDVILPTLLNGLTLEIAYSDSYVTLTVIESGFSIFLPLIVR